jgi:hypothetical protein
MSCSATQELSSIFWNMKVYYRFHKSPPLVPIMSRPIQSIPPHPISPRSILILEPSSYVLVLLVVPFLITFQLIPYKHFFSPPFMLHAMSNSSSLTCSIKLYLAKSTSYEALIMQFSPPSCHFIPLWPKYSLQHRSETPSMWSHIHFADQCASVRISYGVEISILQMLQFQELSICRVFPGGTDISHWGGSVK